MLRIFVLLMLSCTGLSVFAQPNEQFQQWVRTFPPNVASQNFNNIEGTPYLNEKYSPAVVYTLQGKLDGVMLRYNIYNDRMEMSLNSINYLLGPLTQIVKVDWGSQVYKVVKYTYKGKSIHGYLEVLDSGKVNLFSKKVVVFKDKQEPTAIQVSVIPPTFTRQSDVILYQVGNGEYVKFSSVQKMIENFPDKQHELKEYMKKEGIKGKKIEDVVKVVKYYNSTLSSLSKVDGDSSGLN